MLRLQGGDFIAESEVVGLELQWASRNHARHAINLAAWSAALKAFALQSTHGGSLTGLGAT